MICQFICEDITLGVQAELDRQTPGGIGPIADSMFMGQKLDMGVTCVTHTLSGTSPIIRQNAETIIAFSLPGENPRLICDTLGATPEQAERIKTLRPGEFVILNPALWEKCVYATFEKPQIHGKLQEGERLHAVEKFLKRIKASAPAPLDVFKPQPPVKTSEKNGQDSIEQKFSSAHIELMIRVGTGIPQPICKIYQGMGFNRTQGRRLAKRLESVGMIIPHTIATGKRGGRLCFCQVTDYGWEILKKMAIFKPRSKTNGEFIHELAARLIESCEKRKSRSVYFEIDVGGKRLDAQSLNKKTGSRTFFNIGATNPAREAENIEAILKLPVMRTSNFVFVARDTKFAKEVTKLLKDKDPSGKLLRGIEIKTIADFVDV